MPGVEDGVAALGHEEHAEVGVTRSAHARHTVFVHQGHERDIVGQFAAGYERPAATQPEATFRGYGLSGWSCGARKQPPGVAENPCAPRVIQEARPETGQRVVPNDPGNRRFSACQRLKDTQPLFRGVWRGCTSVKEHATEVALT